MVRRHADGRAEVLSSQVEGQAALHADFGGVVPEIAARAHAERLDHCVERALAEAGVPRFEVTQFKQHSLSEGEAASAIAYIQIRTAEGMTRWGAGVNTNIDLASIQAVISALNRLQ